MDKPKDPTAAVPLVAAAIVGAGMMPYKRRKFCRICDRPIGPGDGYRNTKRGTVHTSCAAEEDANGRAQTNPG
jgi:hypothetical protein